MKSVLHNRFWQPIRAMKEESIDAWIAPAIPIATADRADPSLMKRLLASHGLALLAKRSEEQ
jgi:hypothetical protein